MPTRHTTGAQAHADARAGSERCATRRAPSDLLFVVKSAVVRVDGCIWHRSSRRSRRGGGITTDPNELMAPIHNRMPVILPESEWDTWLDLENNDVDALGKLLVPYQGDELEAWPVSTLVNKPVNNGPELIEAAPVDSRR